MYEKYPILTKLTVTLLFLVLLVHAVVAASAILVPVMLAVLFAYLLYPLARKLELWKVPRALADLGTVILAFALLLVIFFLFYKQMGVFVHDVPQIRAQAIRNIALLENYIDTHFSPGSPRQANWLQESVIKLIDSSQGQITSAFTTTAAAFGKLFILPFMLFFLLFYRERFGQFALEIVPDYKQDDMKQVIEEISTVTRKYMGGLFFVVTLLATLNCISLSLMGVKYAIFLGILAAMFNFIPYFGTMIGAVIPVSVVFLTNSSPLPAVGVIVYFLAIQFVEHNLLTPNITGSQVRINPLTTLFSILIWAMLFGIAGMFLAIPYTGMFRIFCDHVSALKPFAKLIGEAHEEDDEEEEEVAVTK